mmetsp:Transcript_7646/g.30196  ORF Transcript_7646/g.30196 Transcript_7646/m.30196 type:complete len:322 (-) Transcript_7646:28-993(-)
MQSPFHRDAHRIASQPSPRPHVRVQPRVPLQLVLPQLGPLEEILLLEVRLAPLVLLEILLHLRVTLFDVLPVHLALVQDVELPRLLHLQQDAVEAAGFGRGVSLRRLLGFLGALRVRFGHLHLLAREVARLLDRHDAVGALHGPHADAAASLREGLLDSLRGNLNLRGGSVRVAVEAESLAPVGVVERLLARPAIGPPLCRAILRHAAAGDAVEPREDAQRGLALTRPRVAVAVAVVRGRGGFLAAAPPRLRRGGRPRRRIGGPSAAVELRPQRVHLRAPLGRHVHGVVSLRVGPVPGAHGGSDVRGDRVPRCCAGRGDLI